MGTPFPPPAAAPALSPDAEPPLADAEVGPVHFLGMAQGPGHLISTRGPLFTGLGVLLMMMGAADAGRALLARP